MDRYYIKSNSKFNFRNVKTNQDSLKSSNAQNFEIFKNCISAALLLGLIGTTNALSLIQPVTFDNNTTGVYDKSEFYADWGIYPGSSSGQKNGRLNIVNDFGTTNLVMQVTYESKEIGGNSAMTFTAPLNGSYRHLFLQYKLKFADNFTWVKGGKLPGLTSGDSPTGCIDNGTFSGFSARRMWRENGIAWSYIYSPVKVERCGDYYAFDYDYYLNLIPVEGTAEGGAISPVQLTQGIWYTLTQEVRLNESGLTNGFIKEWVNGSQVLDLEGLNLDAASPIDQIKMDTFFGGSTDDWAPATRQYSYFDAFSISESMPAMY